MAGMAIQPKQGGNMRRQIQHGIGAMAIAILCAGVGAAGAAEPTPAQRLEVLQRTELPKAQAELKRSQQYCDTQLAVLHARRAMTVADGGGDTSVWGDMEVLTAQCQVTAQQLRSQLEMLEAEQAQLKKLLQK